MTHTSPVVARRAEALATSWFVVDGLHCAACIAKLERGLTALPEVASARVNYTTRRVRVDHLPDTSDDVIARAIERIGFGAHAFAGEQQGAGGSESRRLLLAMAVAGFAAMNIMLLSVSIWSGAEGATRTMFHWISALIALPTVAYAGRPFFASALDALKRGRTNMDVPISIGVILTVVTSLYETATGGEHAYFDGAVMLLFFLLAGRFLDSVMRARAQDGVAALLRRVPADALVVNADGGVERRAIAELAPGMRIRVAAGERIAADGLVLDGMSTVDRSLVTGESVPEDVAAGTRVLAGTVNLSAPITIKVTAAGEASAIADIARLMDSAAQTKSRYVRIADRASRLYAPAVHSLAALTFVGWLVAGQGTHAAMMAAVAVLIITCPCALGLAVPIAQVVAAGSLMRAGVLVKDGSALERLAEADRALFDKTGTITLGRIAVVEGLPVAAEARAALHGVALASRHPLSQAIAAALEGEPAAPVADAREHPGMGVEATVGGRPARLGRVDWIDRQAPHGAGTEVAFRLGDEPLVRIVLADAARPDARAALARLGDQGLDPRMLSGDAPAPVATLSRVVGIPGEARLSPADKHARVVAQQEAGHRVLMVGDGLNDGPALKAASVAIAPAGASDVGQLAADLVFFGERLAAVPIAVAAARRTMRVVRENFVLAIGYNVLAVPLAIAGLVTPIIAAAAMSGSSLIVVANALRLRNCAR